MAVVGQATTFGMHAQLTWSLFSCSPSQLKSPGAQTSWAYGGCPPRHTPDHLGNSVPAQSSEPSELTVHQPTGSPVAASTCVAGTR